MNRHIGTVVSIIGIIVLLIGLAAQVNSLIVIGFFVAIAGAVLGGSRKATGHE